MKKIVLFLILFPIFLFAKEYSLNEVIKIGLNNNDDLKISKLSLENSKSNLKSAIYDFLPTSQLSASQTESKSGSSTSASFSISKTISLNDQSYFNFKKTKVEQKISNFQYLSARKNVIYNIIMKFIAVEENKNNLDILESQLNIQKESFEKSKILFSGKLISDLDLTNAEISKINAEIAFQNSKNSLINSLEELKKYIKLDDDNFVIKDTDFSLYINFEIPKFSCNYQIIQDSLNIVSLKISKQSQKLSFLPDLNLSYSQNISNSDFDENGNFFDVNTNLKNSNSYTFGCNISYSLWNILKHGENYKSFKRNLKKTIISFNKEKNDLYQKYKIEKRNRENLLATYNLYEKKLSLSQKNYSEAVLKYNSGIINQLDFEKTQKTLLEAKMDLKNIQFQLIKSQINIENLLSLKILNKW